jgi:ankyrin repeat protein
VKRLLLTENVLWIACYIGNAVMVQQILLLEGEIIDSPSPDGTTGFSIALAKENDKILQILLRSKVKPKKDMEALFNAAKSASVWETKEIDQE